ncbi:MAG: nitrogen regulation protein NR(II) [Dehalococcoidia bacterium]
MVRSQVAAPQGNRWIRPSSIALGYGAVAGLWILSSGLLLDGIVGRDGSLRSLLEQAKGFAFVGVTALILWLVLRRFERSVSRMADHSARLAQFPQLSPNPVVELAADGSIVSVNMTASQVAHSLGGQIVDFLPVDFPAIARGCIESGQAKVGASVTWRDRTWDWTVFPVGNPDGAYAFAFERTEELRLQAQVEQAARMESVGRIAAGVAHDLNNILTAIGGYASLARMELGPDASTEELDGIRGEVERASILVKKMLSISRMRAIEADIRCFELVAHVSRLHGTLQHLAPSRIRLHLQLPEAEVWVETDAGALEQALLNLVANAVDAIEDHGEVVVEICPDDQVVAVSVRDTGTGIPSEVLPRIFDPFFTTKAEGRGTGLGLASVNAFAKRFGGRLDVRSEVGSGTTVSLRLPAATPTTN